MVKVLSQLSSFLRVWPIPSHNLSDHLLKREESYTVHTVYTVTGTFCFGENNIFLYPTILQQIIYFILLVKKCCIKLSALYLYTMNPSLYRAGHARGRFLGKDDSCMVQHFGHELVIYATSISVLLLSILLVISFSLTAFSGHMSVSILLFGSWQLGNRLELAQHGLTIDTHCKWISLV